MIGVVEWLYSVSEMCRTNLISLSPARRIVRSFLFFLCLIPLGFSGNCQTPGQVDQDSINHYLQIVEEGEKQAGNALGHIGFLYMKAGRYNSAISYFDQALPLLNGENQSPEVARIYLAKGNIYELFGDKAEPGKYYGLARVSYLRAARIIEESGNRSQQMTINQHLADIATKRGNFNQALAYQKNVMKALTQLYKDSLQSQAESFNEMLNKEMESSKDTIYVESVDQTTAAKETVALTNWRHFLILFLTLGLVVVFSNWRSQQTVIQNLQQEVDKAGKVRQKLEQQFDELQNLNLKLTRTEKEQRMSNITKDKIFSIISHDLRSPINTISGLLNVLGAKMASVGDIELRNLVREVNATNERLNRFLDDLLKWSRSQLGQLRPEIVTVDLKQLVQENYALVKPRLKAKNIYFKASIPGEISVYADVNMLRLILRNLISNSIKFTGDNGNISVVLKRGGKGSSVIEVSDDGIGMNDEMLGQLFDFRGTGINGGRRNQGTGLGLLLCKEFVELNGGSIEVVSTPGKGTVFSICLPDHPWEST